MRYALLTLSALLAMAASAAHAQNIVGNPGFETDSFPPWTSTQSGSIVTQVDFSSFAHTGNASGEFTYGGGVGGSGSINQTLTTVGGSAYLLDFWARVDNRNESPATNESLTVDWNGAALPIFLLPNDASYHEYTMSVAATGASTVLSFNSPVMTGGANGIPWQINLDDVSVSAVNPQTPEPGSLALLVASSLSGAAFLVRRRRQTRNDA